MTWAAILPCAHAFGGVQVELVLVLGLLAAAVAMFVANRPRMDVVGLLMIAALPFTGVLTVEEALAGFSDPNIVLIALLFVLGDGLVRSGVAQRLGDWINRQAAGSSTKLLVLLMAATGLLGSVMSSTAIVAIFIPVVFRICRANGIAPGRLMMPMSMAALISGMMTLIATAPNLVVNAELTRQGEDGFGFFSVTPFGLMILLLGIGYMLVARRWLPDRRSDSESAASRPAFKDWIERYKLDLRERRVQVLPGSPLLSMSLGDVDLRREGISLLAVERVRDRKAELIAPSPTLAFQAGDRLLLDAPPRLLDRRRLEEEYGVRRLELDPGKGYLTDLSQQLGMSEAIVRAESAWVGKTVRESGIRSEYGLTVIGLRRANRLIAEDFLDEPLQVGDTLLLTGFWKDLQRTKGTSGNLVVLDLPVEFDEILPAASKAPHAIGILLLVTLLMVTGALPNVQAVLIGCLLLGAFGVVDMRSAYRCISWKSLVLIVGMMPFSMALQRTGGVDLAAAGMLSLVGDGAPRFALAALFVATAVLGLFISNTATAILMAPLALALASGLGVSPYPFAMAVMLSASAAFMTPISSPVNTLVVSPGSYQFGDFVRLGVPFTILVMIVTVLAVPWLLPF